MKPLQFDHLTRNTSRRQVIKGLAATAIGGTLSLGAIGTAFADTTWSEPVYGTPVKQLVVRIVTGNDDDLRQGSQAKVSIGLDDGLDSKQTLELGGLNWNDATQSWDGWPGGSFRLKKFYLPATIFPVLPVVDYIQWFRISFTSGKPDIFSTPDNWNINAIRVLYPKKSDTDPTPTTDIDWNQYYQLFYGSGPNGSSPSGPPLKRFMNIDSWQTNSPFKPKYITFHG